MATVVASYLASVPPPLKAERRRRSSYEFAVSHSSCHISRVSPSPASTWSRAKTSPPLCFLMNGGHAPSSSAPPERHLAEEPMPGHPLLLTRRRPRSLSSDPAIASRSRRSAVRQFPAAAVVPCFRSSRLPLYARKASERPRALTVPAWPTTPSHSQTRRPAAAPTGPQPTG